MAASSPAFERFRASLDAPVTGRDNVDDFDLEALAELSGAEREQAQDLLIARLDGDDGRVANALAALGSQRAVDPLRQALRRLGPGTTRVAVARALTRLTGAPEGTAEIIETLSSADFSRRASAASALGSHRGQVVIDALIAALDDDSAVVRGNALSSLVRVLAVAEHDQGHLSPLGMVRVRVMSELPSVRRAAVAHVRDLADALGQGASAESLGLVRRVDPEVDAIRRYRRSRASDGELDMEALRSLRDLDRDWAITSLLGALADGDTRAPAALAAMNAPEAGDALRDARGHAGEPLRAAIDRALTLCAGDTESSGLHS